MRRFGTVLLLASSVSLAVGYTAVPATAGNTTSFSLSSSATQLKTSTGKSVDLSIITFEGVSSGDTVIPVTLTLRSGSYTRGESHSWTFQVDANDFDYNGNTGKGSLNTGNDLGSFGSLNLIFDKSSQSSDKCPDSGNTTTVKGSLKGTVDFDTKSNSWGMVHANHFSFDMPNFVSLNNSCTGEPNVPQVCTKGIQWSAPYQPGSAGASGFTLIEGGDASTTITGSQLVYLSNDYSVYRSDVVADAAPKPGVNGDKLSIKTKRGSRIGGSATISGGTSDKRHFRCKHGSKHFREVYKTHTGGKWSSPHGLKFNQVAFGDFKTPLDGQAPTWTVESYR